MSVQVWGLACGTVVGMVGKGVGAWLVLRSSGSEEKEGKEEVALKGGGKGEGEREGKKEL